MPAIGMGLAWAGYTGMLWAYCLIRGYNVTLGQLANPVHQLDWKKATGNLTPDTQIVPGGKNTPAPAGSSSSSGSAKGNSSGSQGPPRGFTGSPVKPYG